MSNWTAHYGYGPDPDDNIRQSSRTDQSATHESGAKPMKPVLVTTAHRGVFGGLIPDDTPVDVIPEAIRLTSARMLIRWRSGKGVLYAAEKGLTAACAVSAAADITLSDVTMIADITEEAWASWNS